MIKMIVLDVDGTLTDGKITYMQNGDEIKSFDVKDGLAMSLWIKLGRNIAIITGRESKIIQKRAEEIGVAYIKQGVKNKAIVLDEIINDAQLDIKEVAIIGDDLNDLSMLKKVKYSFAPKNADKEVKKQVYKVLSKNGGNGAVREMIDFIITKEKLKTKIYEIFR